MRGLEGRPTYQPARRNQTYEQYANVGQEIQTLTELENGCDIHIDPLTRQLHIQRKRMSIQPVQFGYNHGAMNVSQFGRQIDSSVMVNYMLATGRPELIARYQDDLLYSRTWAS